MMAKEGEITIDLDEKKAKDLHFVLSHDLITGLLPSDKVDSVLNIKNDLEKKIEKENLK